MRLGGRVVSPPASPTVPVASESDLRLAHSANCRTRFHLETSSANVYKKTKTKRNRSNSIPTWCRPGIWATAMRLAGRLVLPPQSPTVQIASESDLRLAHSANCCTRFRLETSSANVYKKTKTKRNRSNSIPTWCRPGIWATAMRLGGFVVNPIAVPTVPIASESDLRFEHSANCRTRFRLETSSANVYKKTKTKRNRSNSIPTWCRPGIWATAMRLGGFVVNPIAVPTVPIASESDLRLAHSANCRTRFRLETSSANVYKKTKTKRNRSNSI